jgi:hypothetical protein
MLALAALQLCASPIYPRLSRGEINAAGDNIEWSEPGALDRHLCCAPFILILLS